MAKRSLGFDASPAGNATAMEGDALAKAVLADKGTALFTSEGLGAGSQTITNQLDPFGDRAVLGSSEPVMEVYDGALRSDGDLLGSGWVSDGEIPTPAGNFQLVVHDLSLKNLVPAIANTGAGIYSQDSSSGTNQRVWSIHIDDGIGEARLLISADGSTVFTDLGPAFSSLVTANQVFSLRYSFNFSTAGFSCPVEYSFDNEQSWNYWFTHEIPGFTALELAQTTVLASIGSRRTTSTVSPSPADSIEGGIGGITVSDRPDLSYDFRDNKNGVLADAGWSLITTGGADLNDPKVLGEESKSRVFSPGAGNSISFTGFTVENFAAFELITTQKRADWNPTSGNVVIANGASNQIILFKSKTAFNLYIHDGSSYVTHLLNCSDELFAPNAEVKIRVSYIPGQARLYVTPEGGQEEFLAEAIKSPAICPQLSSLSVNSNSFGSSLSEVHVYDCQIEIEGNVYGYSASEDWVTSSGGTQPSTGFSLSFVRSASGLKTCFIPKNTTLIQSDGADDFARLTNVCIPTLTNTTGEYSVLVCMRRYGGTASLGLFSSGAGRYEGASLYLTGGSRLAATARDSSTGSVVVITSGVVNNGEIHVVGGVWDSGTLTAFSHENGTDSADYSALIDINTSVNAPTLAISSADSVFDAIDLDLFSVAVFHKALNETELNAVANYLKGLVE